MLGRFVDINPIPQGLSRWADRSVCTWGSSTCDLHGSHTDHQNTGSLWKTTFGFMRSSLDTKLYLKTSHWQNSTTAKQQAMYATHVISSGLWVALVCTKCFRASCRWTNPNPNFAERPMLKHVETPRPTAPTAPPNLVLDHQMLQPELCFEAQPSPAKLFQRSVETSSPYSTPFTAGVVNRCVLKVGWLYHCRAKYSRLFKWLHDNPSCTLPEKNQNERQGP